MFFFIILAQLLGLYLCVRVSAVQFTSDVIVQLFGVDTDLRYDVISDVIVL